ncbi:MAG: hypothetical protein ACTSPB_01945 [Candidatus Thorarchaeota archaeon]
MGFTWVQSIKPGAGSSQAIMKELKDNVDAVYSDLQLSPFNWSELADTEKITQIDEDDIKELRDAIDYADDMNYCREHDATYYVTYHDDENTTYEAANDAGIDGTYYTTYDNDEHVTVKSGDNSGYDSTDNVTYKNDDDGTVYASYFAGIKQVH